MQQKHKPVVRWLFLGYFLILTMVIVGGITRLTGSGLSMADWKPILGAIPPMNEVQWQEKFDLYKATPEFQKINSHFSLSDFKQIFWWEFIHRDLGRFIGIVFIIPFLIFWKQKRFDKKLQQQMLIILGLGAFQGVLGWYMVSSGLDKVPHVSHYRLAAHLLTALTAMLYVFWVAISLMYPRPIEDKQINKQYWFMFVLIFLQITYGAFTAGLKAGFGNHTLAEVVHFPTQIHSIVNEGTSVLFIHRYLALFIVGITLLFYLNNYKKSLHPLHKKGMNIFLILVLIQVSLGIVTLLGSVPIYLGVLHQVVAVLLITTALYMIAVSRATEKAR